MNFYNYFFSYDFPKLEDYIKQGRYLKNPNDYRLLKNKKTSGELSQNIGIAFILFRYYKKNNISYKENTRIKLQSNEINFIKEGETIKFAKQIYEMNNK